MATLYVRACEASGLPAADRNGLSDPYVVLKVDGKQKHSTKVVDKCLNPVWNEDFTFELKADSKALQVQIFDKDLVGSDDHLGEIAVNLAEIQLPTVQWFHLLDKKGNTGKGKLLLAISKEEGAGKKKDAERQKLLDERLQEAMQGVQRLTLNHREEITVWCGTWNMGNVAPAPAEQLKLWLKPGYDVYAVGVQECTYDADGKLADDWDRRIRAVINAGAAAAAAEEQKEAEAAEEYVLVQQESLMKIRINVYVRRRLFPFIHSVESGREATGIAGVVGNKGGVCVSFSIHDTSLAFVSCHLAAHQEKVERRNADMKEIVTGIKLGEKHVDILNQFDHLIWVGDLNYRVEWGDKPLDRSPSPEVYDEMVKMIEEKRFAELYAKDQLVREMQAGNVFVGFETPPCNFVPTFKVKNEELLKYNVKRFPAWCDRVLVRSLSTPPQLLEYDGVPEVLSSDHKPVYAGYKLSVGNLPPAIDPSKGKLSFKITGLKAKDIPAMDQGGTSDPFIYFLAPYLPDKKFKTPTKPKTLAPEWADNQVPLLESSCNNPERLLMQPLKLKMYDADAVRNETIGTALVHLTPELLSGQPAAFETILERGGQKCGKIWGVLQCIWK